MKKIYVCCLAKLSTGGLTLAHQLCAKLRAFGFDSEMYYYYGHGMEKSNPVHDNYKKYNLPYVDEIEDKEGNIVVVPETRVNLLRRVRKAKKVIWWMSVDNYLRSLNSKRVKFEDLWGLNRYKISQKGIIHFAQSYYAIDYLQKKGVSKESIYYLSDYLDPVFFQGEFDSEKKEDIVLYNPRKGFEFTSKLIDAAPEIKWVPLQNMTPEMVRDTMEKAKVYIDFGNHPGKDRMPRETAMRKCCVITGKRGSAAFFEDVTIPNEYKFDDQESSIPMVIKKIQDIFLNYNTCIEDFRDYREKIKGEEIQFDNDVKKIFSIL